MKRSVVTAAALAIGITLLLAAGARAQGTVTAARPRRRRAGHPDTRRAGAARLQGPHRAEVPHEDRQERRLHAPERVRRPLPHHAEEGRHRGDLVRLQHPGARPPAEAARVQARCPRSPQAAPPPPGSGLAPPARRRRAGQPVEAGRRHQRRDGPLAGGQDRRGDRRLREHPRAGAEVPLVHYNLGTAYKKKGDVPKAEAAMRRSFELDPLYVDGYVGLATILAEGGKEGRSDRGRSGRASQRTSGAAGCSTRSASSRRARATPRPRGRPSSRPRSSTRRTSRRSTTSAPWP